MAKLFDSLKKGVADAGSKAKTIVDANALKVRAGHVQRDIEAEYQAIGALYYSAVSGDATAAPLGDRAEIGSECRPESVCCGSPTGTELFPSCSLQELAEPHVHLIGVRLEELASIREKELELNGERTCPSCHKVMPLESRFCSACGEATPEPPVFEGEVLPE